MKKHIPFILAIGMLIGIFNYDFANEIGNYKFWLFICEIIVCCMSVLALVIQKEKEKIVVAIAVAILQGILIYDFDNEIGSCKFWIFIGKVTLFIAGILSFISQKGKKNAKQL